MQRFFNPDAPLMQGLSRLADLVVFNIFFLICCLPIFTIGAATAALYDAVGRMQRDEGGIYRAYWKAFASNFKQATIQWLFLLLCGVLLAASLFFYSSAQISMSTALLMLAMFLTILWCAIISWVFPLQARFYNSVKNTLQNALLCAVAYLPRTIVMILLNFAPLALALLLPTLFLQVCIVFLVIWFALAAYWTTLLLKKPMEKLTGQSANDNSGDVQATP